METSKPRARVLRSAVVLAALLAAGPSLGSDAPACVERTAEAVQQRYQTLRDLKAHFVQTTRSVALGGRGAPTSRSAGTVQFAKPGKMRWSYTEPEPSLVVSDGRILWIYDPRQREAQRLPVGDGFMSGAGIQFLLGEGDILRDFEVTSPECTETVARLLLVPRKPTGYERLELGVDPATGQVIETQIVDLLGNVTRVQFSEIEVNLDPDDGVFSFEAPDDVRVIDLAIGAENAERGD